MNKSEDVIYRQDAINAIIEAGITEYDETLAIEQVKRVLPAQSEIIMCKDCKHRPIKKDGDIAPPKEDDWKCPCLCEDYYYSWIPRDDFFCANGERRGE